MSWLSVFVSHNFPHYLQNAVQSCRLLYPEAKILVVDNASSRPAMAGLLDRLESESSVAVIRRESNQSERKAGSLHAGYNAAIEYALQGDFEFVHFANDDVQFVYRNDQLLETLRKIYEVAPGTAGIHSTFAKRLSPLAHRLVPLPGVPASLDTAYAVSDNGFVSVKFLKETGFRFLASEGDSSARAAGMGYHACQLHRPVLAFVPWVAARVGSRVVGREFPPPRDLYLKPITGEAARQMDRTPPGEIPTYDDWCRPWGWNALTPYWATAPSLEYVELCAKHVRRVGRSGLPHFIDENGRVSLRAALAGIHGPSVRVLAAQILKEAGRKLLSQPRRAVRRIRG